MSGKKIRKPRAKKEKTPKAAITDQQRLFAKWYPATSFNGKQAAIKAGYSPKNADVAASKLLANPYIQPLIEEETKKQLRNIDVQAADVLQRISSLAFSNLMNFVSYTPGEGLTITDISSLPAEVQSCIAEIQELETTFYTASGTEIKKRKFKIKLKDSIRPLEMLGKNTGILQEALPPGSQVTENIFFIPAPGESTLAPVPEHLRTKPEDKK